MVYRGFVYAAISQTVATVGSVGAGRAFGPSFSGASHPIS